MTFSGPAAADVAEGAVVVEFPGLSDAEANRRAVALGRALGRPPIAGLLDAIPGARTLALFFDPGVVSHETIRRETSSRGVGSADSEAGRTIVVRVAYGGELGPDLAEIAARAGLSPEKFARRHAAGDYAAAFLGFAPGFAYLTGLDPALSSPRLPTPRPRVPPGSVAIGGPYTGIYPSATPGGWRLIGRSAIRLFDEEADPPARIAAGDRVRFEPIDPAHLERDAREAAAASAVSPTSPGGLPIFRLVRPGVFTSVQGMPSHGRGAAALPPGGAMDEASLSEGNARIGNPREARALEMTLLGPELEAMAPAEVCVAGASMSLERNGAGVPPGSRMRVEAGDRLRFGPVRGGVRAYLCLAGGLASPGALGLTRRLEAGAILMREVGGRGAASEGAAGSAAAAPAEASGAETDIVVRVVLDPRRGRFFEDRAVEQFLSSSFRVSSASDRRGVRLEGSPMRAAKASEIPPEATALGTIQIPADGQPILLGPDRPVTGGYARLGAVICADWPRVAQAAPGRTLRFAAVELPEALRLRSSI